METWAVFWPRFARFGFPLMFSVVGVVDAVPVSGVIDNHAAMLVVIVKVSLLSDEVSEALAVCAVPERVPCGMVTPVGFTESPVVCAVTVNETGTTKGSMAPGAVTVIDPVWVPIARLAGFNATLMVFDPPVEPLCGPTANHEPDSVEAA